VLPAFAHAKRNGRLAALVSGDAKKLQTLGKRYGVDAGGWGARCRRAQCIQENREPVPSRREGLPDVRIIRPLYESRRRGSSICVSTWERPRGPRLDQEIYRPPIRAPQVVGARTPPAD